MKCGLEIMGAKIAAILMAFNALLFATSAQAYTCKDRRDSHHILPATIGNPENTEKAVHLLLCDTVQVIAGRVTEVEAGSMLAFGRTNSGNVIRVSGTLKLKGTKDSWVYLSGSIDSSKGKLEPGKATWSGLIVEPGGRLIMEYAGVWGARIPITAKGPKVAIKNSFFTGASGILQPDGKLLELESNFAAVNDIDFEREALSETSEEMPRAPARTVTAKPDGLSAEEKERLLAKPMSKPFWTPGKVWGVAGILAVAGGGAWYYMQGSESGESVVKRETPVFETLPALAP